MGVGADIRGVIWSQFYLQIKEDSPFNIVIVPFDLKGIKSNCTLEKKENFLILNESQILFQIVNYMTYNFKNLFHKMQI